MDLPCWIDNEEGVDAVAWAIITAREPIIQDFLSTYPVWETAIHADAGFDLVGALGLESRLLAPLSKRLAQRAIVRIAPHHQTATVEQIHTILLELLHHTPFRNRRIAWLLDHGFCADTTTAQDIVGTVERYPAIVGGALRGILLDYQHYGRIGTLNQSECGWYDAILLIERWRPFIHEQTNDVPQTQARIALVRTDVIALFRTLSNITITRWRGRQRIERSAWQPHMLHEPAHTDERTRYANLFDATQTAQILQSLADHRHATVEQAQWLWETMLERGIVGMIAARQNDALPTTLWDRRYADAVAYHTQGLQPALRTEITQRFKHMVEWAEDHHLHLPFLALVETVPGDQRRKRAGRRWSFGVGATVKRRQAPMRKSRDLRRRPPRLLPSMTANTDKQIANLATRWKLSLPTTRHHLRDFLSRGLFGLIAVADRDSVVHSEVLEFMKCLKWGYIPGVANQTAVYEQVNAYAEMLQQPIIARTLFHALWNSLAVPQRWHGGAGPPLDTVRQRKTMVVPVPRLHEQWVCIPWDAPIPLIGYDQHPISQHTYAVVVLDTASRLPMGIWYSPQPLTAEDYGLALYTAIWHPTYPEYPVRGIPEHIVLPKQRIVTEWMDIRRAFAWSVTRLSDGQSKDDDEDYPKQQAWTEYTLIVDGIMKATMAEFLTRQQTLFAPTIYYDTFHCWDTQFFSQHRRVPLPLRLAMRGVSNYGTSTPIAGWLLPVVDRVESRVGGYVENGTLHSFDALQDTYKLWNKRTFPFRYPSDVPVVFLENGTRIIATVEI